MARSKKPRRKQSKYNKVRRILTGTTMTWNVVDPLADGTPVRGQLGHKVTANTMHVRQAAKEIQILVQRYPFEFRVDIECEFKDPFGVTYFKPMEMICNGFISGADEYYYDAVESIFAGANMDHYIATHVCITILGPMKAIKMEAA